MAHQSDPTYYACCHPLPVGGKVDPKCRSVGDVCNEGEENCVCEFGEEWEYEEDDDDARSASPIGDDSGSQGNSSDFAPIAVRGWSALARAFLQMT